MWNHNTVQDTPGKSMQTFKYKWDWNIFKNSHIENAGQLHHNFHQHFLSHSSTLKTKEQRLLSKCYIQHQSSYKREFQIRLSYSAINNKIIKLSEMLSLDCRRSQEIFGLEPSEVWTEPKRASEGTLHFINTSSVCLHSAKQYTHFC